MRSILPVLAALSLAAGTVFSAPAQAQVSPYHNGIVVPGACYLDLGNRAGWTTYNGHHVLALNSVDGLDNAGFEVYGNTDAVLHGVLPSTFGGCGQLPTGYLSFQVVSFFPGPGEPADDTDFPYFFYNVFSNTGETITSGFINNLHPGTKYVPIPPANGLGAYPAYVTVSLGYHPLSGVPTVRALIGAFTINGIEIHATTQVDTSTTGTHFCDQPPNDVQ